MKDFNKGSASRTGWILLPDQMDALAKRPYAYNATAGSLLELLFLQKFWMWLAKLVPACVAPCVLTCLGLSINLASCFVLLYFSPDARSEAPSWAFLCCAIGVFLYQTLDALDGKQCVKVQDTQIEEVYDHGCDAISTVFLSLTTAIACQWGSLPTLMFCVFLMSMLAFYTTHWQDHVTHIMVFGKLDVSELQFSIIALHLGTAYFGQSIWKLEVLGFQLRVLFALASMVIMAYTIASNISYVLGHKTPLDDYVKIPRKRSVTIWYPVIPLVLLTVFTVRAFVCSFTHMAPCLFSIAFGLAYAKITIRLVIANVTHADMDIWDSSLVAPFLLCLNTVLPASFHIPYYTALLCGLLYSAMDLARYFTYVSWDMSDVLDARIFSVKYPPGHPKSKRPNRGVYVNGLNNREVLAPRTSPSNKKS